MTGPKFTKDARVRVVERCHGDPELGTEWTVVDVHDDGDVIIDVNGHRRLMLARELELVAAERYPLWCYDCGENSATAGHPGSSSISSSGWATATSGPMRNGLR
jgi:hypothetical protein